MGGGGGLEQKCQKSDYGSLTQCVWLNSDSAWARCVSGACPDAGNRFVRARLSWAKCAGLFKRPWQIHWVQSPIHGRSLLLVRVLRLCLPLVL
jgi:hypothetical protein